MHLKGDGMDAAGQVATAASPPVLLHFENRSEWRSWLKKNHAKMAEVWFTHYKAATGKASVRYEEAVEEALCFGWVDGKKKSIDSERYAYRYTPRGPKSTWSVLNIQRAQRLITENKMTEAGLKAFSGHEKRKTIPLPTLLPKNLQQCFESNETAWKNFERFPAGYKKLCIGWVAIARKEETQKRRLDSLIQHSAKNTRIEFI